MKTKYTFWELISEYCIEIPKIQRDYVQGRKDKDIEKIADKFLKDLHCSIINEGKSIGSPPSKVLHHNNQRNQLL